MSSDFCGWIISRRTSQRLSLFGSHVSCSACHQAHSYSMQLTIRHHLTEYSATYPDVVKKISRSTYIDNIASGADTEDLAYQLHADFKMIFGEGSFNLRKFVTNSSALDENEHLIRSPPTDQGPGDGVGESYTKLTLGTTQQAHAGETRCSV